mmetsp:Transcript_44299/g.139576  ORF Transcript_44299/g.139576 Transcript_44299/m.139576 type:complete len:239 (+) Transcript_44299:143-859(+)
MTRMSLIAEGGDRRASPPREHLHGEDGGGDARRDGHDAQPDLARRLAGRRLEERRVVPLAQPLAAELLRLPEDRCSTRAGSDHLRGVRACRLLQLLEQRRTGGGIEPAGAERRQLGRSGRDRGGSAQSRVLLSRSAGSGGERGTGEGGADAAPLLEGARIDRVRLARARARDELRTRCRLLAATAQILWQRRRRAALAAAGRPALVGRAGEVADVVVARGGEREEDEHMFPARGVTHS